MSNENRDTAIDKMLHELEHALRSRGSSDALSLVRAFSEFVGDYAVVIRVRDNEFYVTIEAEHENHEQSAWDADSFALDGRFSLKSLPGIFIAYTVREPFVYYSIHDVSGNEILYLAIENFDPIGHFYGTILRPDIDGHKSIDLYYKMNKEQAARMLAAEPYGGYTEGSRSSRFFSVDDVVSAARAWAVQNFGDDYEEKTILIMGDSFVAEPQHVVWAPHEIFDQLQGCATMMKRYHLVGGWDNYSNEMKTLCNIWESILQIFVNEEGVER